MSELCKICAHKTEFIFEGKLLKKYNIRYFRCPKCDFIQTENPFWLEEAYNSAISSLDIGLINRNLRNQLIISNIINLFFDRKNQFIDYGGGYGMFVRMMRDNGYDYYRQDIYCDNIFAQNFDVSNLKDNVKFELLTAFEVFEHLNDPINEIQNMLKYSDNIFFSTEIHNKKQLDFNNYWYFLPETGQHISFFSKESLNFLSKKFNLNYYTNGTSLHLLSKKKINSFLFYFATNHRFIKILTFILFKNKSLLSKDFEKIKNSLK